MKTPIALALCALTALPAAAQDAPAAAPEAKAQAPVEGAPQAEAAPEKDAVAVAPGWGSFCGQQAVQAWLWQTEVGKELKLPQQAEMKRAFPGFAREAAKAKQEAPAAATTPAEAEEEAPAAAEPPAAEQAPQAK